MLSIHILSHDHSSNNVKSQVGCWVVERKGFSSTNITVKNTQIWRTLLHNDGQESYQMLRGKPRVKSFSDLLPVLILGHVSNAKMTFSRYGEENKFTCLSINEFGPIKSTMRSTEGDFVTLFGKSFDGRDICSATSWLATMIIGGTIGLLSTMKNGGLPRASCISAKMTSRFLKAVSTLCLH